MILEPKPKPSTVYFILDRDEFAYSEIGVNAHGELFIRETRNGEVSLSIPLGPANAAQIELLQNRLDTIAQFFDPTI